MAGWASHPDAGFLRMLRGPFPRLARRQRLAERTRSLACEGLASGCSYRTMPRSCLPPSSSRGWMAPSCAGVLVSAASVRTVARTPAASRATSRVADRVPSASFVSTWQNGSWSVSFVPACGYLPLHSPRDDVVLRKRSRYPHKLHLERRCHPTPIVRFNSISSRLGVGNFTGL